MLFKSTFKWVFTTLFTFVLRLNHEHTSSNTLSSVRYGWPMELWNVSFKVITWGKQGQGLIINPKYETALICCIYKLLLNWETFFQDPVLHQSNRGLTVPVQPPLSLLPFHFYLTHIYITIIYFEKTNQRS